MDLRGVDWVRGFPDDELKRVFGAATFFRGKSYQEFNRVKDLEADDEVLSALVTGSANQVYAVEIRRGTRGLVTWCSCPMRAGCKHVVATIRSARSSLKEVAATPSWERQLGQLVHLESGSEATGRAMALEFSLPSTQYGPLPSRVRLAPLREGARAPWVKTGASWTDLVQAWRSTELNPPQRAVLAQLFRLSPDAQFAYGSTATLDLADLGPLAWPMLRRIVAAGIELVPGEGLRSLTLADESATVSLDLTRSPDGGIHAQARATVIDPEAGGRVFLIGNPAHGFAHLNAGELTLWPLAAPPPEGLEGLLTEGTGVEIPADDVNRFLTLYYPALARSGAVTTSDGSIEPPDLSPPRLRLGVTHLSGHVAELRWGFAYPSPLPGGEPTVVPLVATPGGPPREHHVEQRLAAHAATLLSRHPTLLGAKRHPLAEEAELRGMAVAPFLSETLPALREAGVVVDEVGDAVDYAEADEAPVIHLTSDDTEDRDWFNLHVTVTVDGQAVPFDQLFHALAAGDDALLLDSGTWFSLDIPELHDLRRLIEEARDLTDDATSGSLRLSPYQAGLWEELVGLGVVARQSQRWTAAVERLLPDADRSDVPLPEGLNATLRPYQVHGYQWLTTLWDARLGGVLADDMGLGKTLQTLALFERAREAGQLDGSPVLVVAPASVVGTWVDEAAKFAPGLKVVAITATGKKRGDDVAAAVAGAHVVVTSYTLMRLEDAEYRALPWSGLILDEAQFVKNHRSRTYQAARRLGAPFTLAITGTPLENSLMDLWAMLSLAAPGLFPRPEHFIERFRKPIEAERDLLALETLRRRIKPFVLRRTKREVVQELPEKIEQVQRVELTPAHRKVYDKYLQRERQRVLGMLDDIDRNRVAIFRALTMLRQLALDPVLVDPGHSSASSAKVTALVEQVTELAAEGHRALVFSSFTGYLKLVREALDDAGISYAYLDGRTRDRPARIAQFREGTDPVFLISLKAGGFGLTLTEADYVFVLDPWWNPAAENQAIDRTHRIGQTRSVNVYRMVSEDTIEEKVVALQERKRDLFTSVIDSGSFSSGAITAADIRGLFDE
ncbi:DEAD/DEAH box helicase [Tessaracoccus sp. Z1128]